jgi:isocitrate dehydrogenase kinase/phosphatase
MTGAAAARLAAEIEAAYDTFTARFMEITGRAKHRFEARQWRRGQWDAAERLMVYKISVDTTVERLTGDPAAADPETGSRIKDGYAERIARRPDAELAETFFNSVVRRLFGTVGVNPGIEFFDTAAERATTAGQPPVHRTYPADRLTPELFQRILAEIDLNAAFRSLDADAREVARRTESQLHSHFGSGAITAVEVLPNVFFRNKAAYLVGRICTQAGDVPLLLPLLHLPEGVAVDAVLTTSNDASAVFGFTRSYFHVQTDHPRAVVDFLREIMPNKRIDELYTAIGYHKHGKRELFRELKEHLAHPDSRFEVAEGKKGLVMIVFNLPSLNVVFKVIRDAFGPTKETSRSSVMAKYRMVFLHDRVGRLADAQEFELLEFRRQCFAPELLEELMREAADSVTIRDSAVVVSHLYTERRVTPLDIFLQQADPEAARHAIIDYGNAMRDLAAANIFPGDMLLKNFGVTRHGRVIFYDYDELSLLTEINFRRMPEARDPWDEMSSEPWFHVGERDVFPEEFLPFLVPAGPLRDTFVEHHAELLDVAFWKRMQESQKAGEVIDFFPYPAERRLGTVSQEGRRERGDATADP